MKLSPVRSQEFPLKLIKQHEKIALNAFFNVCYSGPFITMGVLDYDHIL